jgi:dimethylamine monooxygenase subunit A
VSAPALVLPRELPDYFPPAVGRYEVKPGLVRFGKPLGGGKADEHVFQLDATFPCFREAKLAARRERLNKYFLTERFDRRIERVVSNFIVDRLVKEHPQHFKLDRATFECALTGERLRFDAEFNLLGADAPESVEPPYKSALDALAMQVQEDLAVVSTGADGGHWLSALHVCVPNHWAPAEKIGRAFPTIHEPVAGMEQMNRQGDQLVRIMIGAADGLVRFAWGITWDDELNHHPDPAPGSRRSTGFDAEHPRAFLRVERQTIWGFPNVGATLFTIRPYLYDVARIRRNADRRDNLSSAVRSMSADSLAYKGLTGSRDALLRWLTAAADRT